MFFSSTSTVQPARLRETGLRALRNPLLAELSQA